MFGVNVRLKVALLLGLVVAVRTVEPRSLAALQALVAGQVVPVLVRPAASCTHVPRRTVRVEFCN